MGGRQRHGMHGYGRSRSGQPWATRKDSIFASRPHQQDINNPHGVTVWTLATVYCKEKFITYDQLKYFIRKKWMAVSSCKNRIYVCELCPLEIENHLGGI